MLSALAATNADVRATWNAVKAKCPALQGDELVRAYNAWNEAFDSFAGNIEEYIDVDDRYVGCVVDYRGTQRSTGLEVHFRAVDMWEVRGGKLARGTLAYPDRQSALEAVGSSSAPQARARDRGSGQ